VVCVAAHRNSTTNSGMIPRMNTTTAPTAHSLPGYPPRADLRRRILAGESTIGAWASLGSLASTEQLARAGFDWLVIDLEHGAATEADMYAQLLAIQSTSTAALVRPQSAERLRVGRALDTGADGLVVPRLETAAEVADTISWMRFPPAGSRGLALTTRGAGMGAETHESVAAAVNPRILGVFQIESPAAVSACHEMAALDGVDVLFVGPADLSHSMGIPGRFDEPAFIAALDAVVAAARAHGKGAGILLKDGAAVPAYRDRGFTFIGIGSDAGWVRAGATAQLAVARAALAG
jgi:2-dehydro-3-deoxyglucarate aldolase/4-hydroxy-2-oxoheptanedioate aldolase